MADVTALVRAWDEYRSNRTPAIVEKLDQYERECMEMAREAFEVYGDGDTSQGGSHG